MKENGSESFLCFGRLEHTCGCGVSSPLQLANELIESGICEFANV